MSDTPVLMGKMPISMKDIIFQQLMHLIDKLRRENNADYKVLLFTSCSTILGRVVPCATENEMIKYTDDPQLFTLDISSIFSVLEREYKAEGAANCYSDAYMLNIVDAILYKPGTREEFARMDQMIVFVDQIIGFSLINTFSDSQF